MSFYVLYLYALSFSLIFGMAVPENVIFTSGVDAVSPLSVALRFFINVNNTGDEDVKIECRPDQCCLTTYNDEDCDTLKIIGGCYETVPKKTTRTLKLAAPLINSLQRRGYCVVYLDMKTEGRGVTRNTARINFDTTIIKNRQSMDLPYNVTLCDQIDEDPFNNCRPVNCVEHYNDKKPYYNKRLKRCVEAPSCITDSDNSEVVYIPSTNKCESEAITEKDIDFLKSLTAKGRQTKDILLIKSNSNRPHDSNRSSIKNSADKLTKSKFPDSNDETSNLVEIQDSYFEYMLKYITTNKYTLLVLTIVILLQCCLICTMVYCLTNNCQYCKEKKVISKFFNYRQDVSVTTPLIYTSNIDTETTENQYYSESSGNIDKKIKCYKACHKNKNNKFKTSLSDDILSKCLTRRDWIQKPKSEDIREICRNSQESLNSKHKDFGEVHKINFSQSTKKDTLPLSEQTVNFENEVPKTKLELRPSKKLARSLEIREDTKIDKKGVDTQLSSEKEIQCHSYEHELSSPNKLATLSNKNSNKQTISLSTEKGVQAYFSNDSLDDFLSERGLNVFLAGESVSKYKFLGDTNSNSKLASSEMSNKTSKNNIIKNVLSLLKRRSKHSRSSDPGTKKKDNLDLELLHMSQASVLSSSIATEFIGNLKRETDSRSSL